MDRGCPKGKPENLFSLHPVSCGKSNSICVVLLSKGKTVRWDKQTTNTYWKRFSLSCRWWSYFGSRGQPKRLTWSSDLSGTRNNWGGRVVQEKSIDWKALNSPCTSSRKTLAKLWGDWNFKEEKIALVILRHGKYGCNYCSWLLDIRFVFVPSLINWQNNVNIDRMWWVASTHKGDCKL